jgi:hypothetical protein
MTIASIVVAAIVVAGVLYWLIRSGREEARRLDGLHISPGDKDER